jgi:hypothetical protein
MIKSRNVRWVGLVTCMGDVRNMYKIEAGKLGGKRPL